MRSAQHREKSVMLWMMDNTDDCRLRFCSTKQICQIREADAELRCKSNILLISNRRKFTLPCPSICFDTSLMSIVCGIGKVRGKCPLTAVDVGKVEVAKLFQRHASRRVDLSNQMVFALPTCQSIATSYSSVLEFS